MSLLVLAISLPLALVMILVGLAKVQRLPASLALAARVGVSGTFWQLWGGLDLLCAGALIVGAFASTSLAIVSAATIVATLSLLLVLQIKAREPLALLVPVVALLLVAGVDVLVLVVDQ